MSRSMGLWNNLLDDHKNHGSSGKSQSERQNGLRHTHGQRAEHGRYRFNDTGKLTVEKCLFPTESLPQQGHGNGRPFRQILEADTEHQRQGSGKTGFGTSHGRRTEGYAHSQTFRDIVERYGKDQQYAARQPRMNPFFKIFHLMNVRKDHVQQPQRGSS